MSLNEEKLAQIFGFVLKPIGNYFVKRSSFQREIASDLLISPERTSITLQPSLKIKKRFQKISLSLENWRHNISTSDERLIFSDGTFMNPQKDITVEILDEHGNEYLLESVSYGVNHFDSESETFAVCSVNFHPETRSLPKNRTYTEIKIRSEKPFYCSKIFWVDYNSK